MNWKNEADELKKINPKHILFLCVANSARSQMAEGIAKSLAHSSIQISSAGSKPSKVNPLAIEALKEINIDIKSNFSKSIDAIDVKSVDAVITLCGEEVCPVFLGNVKRLHWGLPDPHNDIQSFQEIRDELKLRLEYLFLSINQKKNEQIKNAVKENYGKLATQKNSCGCSPACCTPTGVTNQKISSKLGYSEEDMKRVPDGANLGLGCGNPKIFASLKKGETVLDLGSGAGFDCFIACNEVGKTGRVIGIDMTPEMIKKAKQNAKKGKYINVEFRLGEIEKLPVDDSSIDVIISNCVINLSTDKPAVFKEAFRVLKNGGRLAISDVIKTAILPKEINEKIEAYTGCISGAIALHELEGILKEVGFSNIKITPKNESQSFIRDWLPGSNIEKYVQSAFIEAKKT